MSQGWSAQGEVSQALRTVIADFGSQVLGNPDMLGNLLKDHIPDHPREINVLQAAAQSGAAAAVDDRIRSGMAPAAAVRMTAAELTNFLAIDPTAAEWGVGEFAKALGYTIEPAATAPLADVTQLPAAQPLDQQLGATIAAPIPSYAGPPQTGYPPPQLQQPFHAPPQPPADRTKSRGRLVLAVIGAAVVVAGAAVFFSVVPGPGPLPPTGAKCLVGNWALKSGHETINFTGFGSEVWDFTSGTDHWSFVSGGTGKVTDSRFLLTTAPSASTPGRYWSTASGTFDYQVVGSQIQYSSVHVPGTITWLNLNTSQKKSETFASTWNSAPDQFSCSGNTLRRYGSGYSFSYARQ